MLQLSDFKGNQADMFMLEVQMGQVRGASIEWVSSYSDSVDSTPSVIWSGTGDYVFPTSAGVISVVSTNTGDTQDLYIVGLDANYNITTETLSLNGLTPVNTVNSYIRVNSVYNTGAADLLGDVTGSFGGNEVFHIASEIQKTSIAALTIPAGKTGYLFQGSASTNKLDGIDFKFFIRQFGGRFILEEHFGLYQNIYDTPRPFIPIPEKSDIKVNASIGTGAAAVTAQFGILLLDNAIWKDN